MTETMKPLPKWFVKSPNRWSCLPAAFAMALEEPLEKIFDKLGHDGSDVIDESLEEPYKRRCFHIQEMVDFAASVGYLTTEIQLCPILAIGQKNYAIWKPEACATRFKNYITNFMGVLVGKPIEGRHPHAVYWDRSMVHDPNGSIYDLNRFEARLMFVLNALD